MTDLLEHFIRAFCAALGSTIAVVFRVSKDQKKHLPSRFVVGAVGGFFSAPMIPVMLSAYRPEIDIMGITIYSIYFLAGAACYAVVELLNKRQKQALGENDEAKNGND